MFKLKKITGIIALVLAVAMLFTGCAAQGGGKPAPGPEVGVWHAEIKLSDLSGSMSDEDKMLMSMLAGNIMFEVDAEFTEDGSFTYIMNTDKLEEAISGSVSTILGFFMSFDVSMFVERLVEAAMKDAMASSKQEYYGTYTKADDGLITATDGENLYFKVSASTLLQVDQNGEKVLRFKKVS